jgi:hypothetical protein
MLATTSENLSTPETLIGGDDTEVVLDSNALMRLFAAPEAGQPLHRRREYKRRVKATTELNAAARRRSTPPRRCSCGLCYTCRENARWEQIFQEKFADPTYYQRGLVSFESPLHVR